MKAWYLDGSMAAYSVAGNMITQGAGSQDPAVLLAEPKRSHSPVLPGVVCSAGHCGDATDTPGHRRHYLQPASALDNGHGVATIAAVALGPAREEDLTSINFTVATCLIVGIAMLREARAAGEAARNALVPVSVFTTHAIPAGESGKPLRLPGVTWSYGIAYHDKWAYGASKAEYILQFERDHG
jgi:hypothetical protein